MKRTHGLVAALLLSLTLILTGCGSGGGSDDDGIASATGKSSDDSKEDPGAASDEDRQAAGLKFAQCMREHGVDMEDPKGGRIAIKSGPGQEDIMQKAQEACQKHLPKPSEADRKQMNEQGLEFAQCMRKNGVEKFPDPKGGLMRMNEGIADDPDFEKAQEACQDVMGGGSPAFKAGEA